MRPPRLRPVFTALLCLGFGILLAPFVSLSVSWLYALSLLSLGAGFTRRSFSILFLYVPLLFIGMARAEQSMVPGRLDVSRWQGQPSLWYQGVIDSDVQQGTRGQVRFTLAVTAAYDYRRTYPADGKALVTLLSPPDRAPAPGTVLWLRGRIVEPAPATNPGGFDYREYLRRRGIFSLLPIESPADIDFTNTETSMPWYRQWSLALRNHVLATTSRYLSPDDATLMNGLLLSAHLSTRNRIPIDLTEAFANTGAVHILSVSGFHLTILSLLLVVTMRLLTAPRPLKNLLCIGLLWIFVLASGSSTPAIRSAIMATIILSAPLVRRHAEPLHSLCAAAAGILLAEPGALYDPGFQLSFTVTATLLLWLPPLLRLPVFRFEPAMTWIQRCLWLITIAFLTGVIAALGTAPLTAYHFNRFSLVSPIAGVVLGFLSEALLVGGLVASLASVLPHFLIAPVWWIIGKGLGLLRFFVYAFAALPGASLITGTPPVLLLTLYYLVLGGTALIVRQHIRKKNLVAPTLPATPPASPARMPTAS